VQVPKRVSNPRGE